LACFTPTPQKSVGGFSHLLVIPPTVWPITVGGKRQLSCIPPIEKSKLGEKHLISRKLPMEKAGV
jgi:hypothetical protein